MAKMLSGLVHVRPGDDASTRGEQRKLTIAAAMLLCILLSTHAFAQMLRLVENWQLGGNLQLRFGSALKHHRLNIAGSSRGFDQEQRQVTSDSTGALYFEGLKQVPDPGSTAWPGLDRGAARCPAGFEF